MTVNFVSSLSSLLVVQQIVIPLARRDFVGQVDDRYQLNGQRHQDDDDFFSHGVE